MGLGALRLRACGCRCLLKLTDIAILVSNIVRFEVSDLGFRVEHYFHSSILVCMITIITTIAVPLLQFLLAT